ncbi:GNAT family N-acetyltransferase [Planomonospora sp. ID82291]|uniref:GNAT family N-acetyltransferase n=1 Tax=Planomonospora sp. ID82291 TaxID=2738136 RepID=UPI0018C4129D|nr:GNAT family N-acetyltransferase [Planomonospora sp. ID82291]MBG0818377.1 GNAT family N-acetyltransferase [Planomonospora sp. ID82291]
MTQIQFRRHDAHAAKEFIDELVDIYAEVYSVPPYGGDPFFSAATYSDRLRESLELPGFECVTARRGEELLGCVHGSTLTPERAWWAAVLDAQPLTARAAAASGDIFWLRELMVRHAHAGQGLGRRLHDEILAGRTESWTALTCIIGNEPAHSAYLRWGYVVLGEIKHAPESPRYSVMLREPVASPGSDGS